MFRAASKSRLIRRFAAIVALSTLVPVLVVVAVLWASAGARAAALGLVIGLGLALLCAALAVTSLVRRYMPGFAALLEAFESLGSSDFAMVPADLGRDDVKAAMQAFNRNALRVQTRHANLQTLGEVDRLLLQPGGLEPVLDAILTRVLRVTGCSSAGIVLRDPDAPWRGRVYLAAKSRKDLPVSRVALDDDMMITLAAEPEGLTVTRCEDARHSFLVPLKSLGSEFFWVWPVKLNGHLEAILAVGYEEPPVADPHTAQCGSEFAGRLAIALSKSARDEQLYRQAHFDPLTALPNRVLFCTRLSTELQNAALGIANGAVLYIDLDHFKKINDTVGHAAGDQVLSIAAQRLRAAIKEGDTVARLGGDEFAIILRDVVSAEATQAVAQRIVLSLQQPVNLAARDHTVCASIGIALYPQDGETIDELPAQCGHGHVSRQGSRPRPRDVLRRGNGRAAPGPHRYRVAAGAASSRVLAVLPAAVFDCRRLAHRTRSAAALADAARRHASAGRLRAGGRRERPDRRHRRLGARDRLRTACGLA